MNLFKISRLANKRLSTFLFSNENGGLGLDFDFDRKFLETKGDLLDLAQLIEDEFNYTINEEHPSSGPLEEFFNIKHFLMASSTILTHEKAKKIIEDIKPDFIQKYPNLFDTMLTWAWG